MFLTSYLLNVNTPKTTADLRQVSSVTTSLSGFVSFPFFTLIQRQVNQSVVESILETSRNQQNQI